MKRTDFPICNQCGLLRTRRIKRLSVSTSALYELLGNDIYQQSCKVFKYLSDHSWLGPLPETIENFLRTDAGAQAVLKRKARHLRMKQ